MSKKRDWDKVGEIVSKIKELGLTYKEGAIRYGIEVGLLYEYDKRQNILAGKSSPSNPEAELNQSCKANKAFPGEIEELITEYRRENPDHGFKRIQENLKSKHLVVVTRKQIRKVLKHHGLLGNLDSSFDRKKEPRKGRVGLRLATLGNCISRWRTGFPSELSGKCSRAFSYLAPEQVLSRVL